MIQYVATVPVSHVNQTNETKCIQPMPVLVQCVERTPQAHKGSMKLPAVPARQTVPNPLWSMRNLKGSSSATKRMAPRAARSARMTKANNHTRMGAISFVTIGSFGKPYHLSKRDVSQQKRQGEQ
jgi:hypothetical protein